MAPITVCTKKDSFTRTIEAYWAFQQIKEAMCKALVNTLLNHLRQSVMLAGEAQELLIQKRRLFAYFSEKLNQSKLNYSTYYEEFFFSIVRALAGPTV